MSEHGPHGIPGRVRDAARRGDRDQLRRVAEHEVARGGRSVDREGDRDDERAGDEC
jgi:hypothetical protein